MLQENNQLDRHQGHMGFVVWLTGLSGAGKTTIARALERRLLDSGRLPFVLDGDVLRSGLCKDLAFSAAHRHEMVRRVTEVAALMADARIIVICALISPFREDRALAKLRIGEDRFIEVYVNTPMEVCESRDPKGLWRKARKGEIKQFTGIDSPYEVPEYPDCQIYTNQQQVEQCVDSVEGLLLDRMNTPSKK